MRAENTFLTGKRPHYACHGTPVPELRSHSRCLPPYTYTFANSLVALSDAAREINKAINPDQSIEVRIEAIGDGSFRALLKRVNKGLGGFFSRGSEALLWSILSFLIIERLLKSDPAVVVQVSDDQVVITRGSDRIIVPRNTYDKAVEVKSRPEVDSAIRHTFDVLQSDEAIENFGLTPSMVDPEPLIQVQRENFGILSARDPQIEAQAPGRRKRKEKARVVITKPWLKDGNRKWSFEWNGVPISAPVRSPNFMTRILSREILVGAGDALDVIIEYYQNFSEALEVYVNDTSTYEITSVIRYIPADGASETLIDT